MSEHPQLYDRDMLETLDSHAEKIASEIGYACYFDREEPDAAFESVSDDDFDSVFFDEFEAEYIANESLATDWGNLINFKKEIKMAGNAMSKAAGPEIKLLPEPEGFATSKPRKKDGQFYTRATLVFSDGQSVRILFYNPDNPEERHRYKSNVVSFQTFLNKKDITAHLVKGGGKDYGPRKFGTIIGKLVAKNSKKFQKKNAEIKAQKAEITDIDQEIADLDSKIGGVKSGITQAAEKNVFLLKQHADWKTKSEEGAAKKKAETDRQKQVDESMVETEAGKEWTEGNSKHWLGNKFDESLDTKDIAKLIRAEMKKARKSGAIIDDGAQTYSVRIDRNEIRIHLKSIPEGIELYSDVWKEYLLSGSQEIPKAYKRYSEQVKNTLDTVEALAKQYQKSEFGQGDDYSANNFYVSTGVDRALSDAETERVKSAVDTGGEVETTEPQADLKALIAEEIAKLKADPEMPDFKLGLRVGKKKDGTAGKVSLDLKSADVPTLEALDYLKLAINNIVSAHTDNFELKTGKATAEIEIKSFDGTDEFKKVISGSVNLDDYSEFKSSKVIDAAVKEHGGSVKWSMEGENDYKIIMGIVTVPGGDGSGKVEMGSDGKAYFFINGERLKHFQEKDIFGEEVNQWKQFYATEDEDSQKSAVNEMMRQLNPKSIEQKDFNPSVGDTVYLHWLATGKDEAVNYRGRDGDQAVIVKDGQQMSVPFSDLKPSPDTTEEPEAAQQEQVEPTGVTQTEEPEEGDNKRDIGSEYKDRNGVKKLVTHEIDGDKVSAVPVRGYIHSAYLRGDRWIDLPAEEKTLVSEADLKTLIVASKEAYTIADDILDGDYDSQGYKKVDKLLDQVAETIQDDDLLIRIDKHMVKLMAKRFEDLTAEPLSA